MPATLEIRPLEIVLDGWRVYVDALKLDVLL